MSQAAFARSFGFTLDAVELGAGPASARGRGAGLLKVIEREPDAVRRALAA